MANDEHWLPVVGHESTHAVSDLGRVWSQITEKVLTGRLHDAGYRRYYMPGGKYMYGHTMVLEAFVGPRPEGYHCCHGDGDPANNNVGNLRWDSVSGNRHDTVRHGRHHNALKGVCPRGHRLADWNNTSSARKGGRRNCLACDRTSSYVRYHSELRGDFKRISDAYYGKILEAASNG